MLISTQFPGAASAKHSHSLVLGLIFLFCSRIFLFWGVCQSQWTTWEHFHRANEWPQPHVLAPAVGSAAASATCSVHAGFQSVSVSYSSLVHSFAHSVCWILGVERQGLRPLRQGLRFIAGRELKCVVGAETEGGTSGFLSLSTNWQCGLGESLQPRGM